MAILKRVFNFLSRDFGEEFIQKAALKMYEKNQNLRRKQKSKEK